jgi:hypothetical protein
VVTASATAAISVEAAVIALVLGYLVWSVVGTFRSSRVIARRIEAARDLFEEGQTEEAAQMLHEERARALARGDKATADYIDMLVGELGEDLPTHERMGFGRAFDAEHEVVQVSPYALGAVGIGVCLLGRKQPPVPALMPELTTTPTARWLPALTLRSRRRILRRGKRRVA